LVNLLINPVAENRHSSRSMRLPNAALDTLVRIADAKQRYAASGPEDRA
jgi:hypothetical protein